MLKKIQVIQVVLILILNLFSQEVKAVDELQKLSVGEKIIKNTIVDVLNGFHLALGFACIGEKKLTTARAKSTSGGTFTRSPTTNSVGSASELSTQRVQTTSGSPEKIARDAQVAAERPRKLQAIQIDDVIDLMNLYLIPIYIASMSLFAYTNFFGMMTTGEETFNIPKADPDDQTINTHKKIYKMLTKSEEGIEFLINSLVYPVLSMEGLLVILSLISLIVSPLSTASPMKGSMFGVNCGRNLHTIFEKQYSLFNKSTMSVVLIYSLSLVFLVVYQILAETVLNIDAKIKKYINTALLALAVPSQVLIVFLAVNVLGEPRTAKFLLVMTKLVFSRLIRPFYFFMHVLLWGGILAIKKYQLEEIKKRKAQSYDIIRKLICNNPNDPDWSQFDCGNYNVSPP